MGEQDIIFPQLVAEAAEDVADNLLSSPGFREEYPRVTKKILTAEFGKLFFNKWLAGEDLVLDYTEAGRAFYRCVTISVLNEMLADNLIDIIDDGAVEHVFLTQKGKKHMLESTSVIEFDVINTLINT